MPKFLIIGAGFLGCAVALELSRRGYKSVILEQDMLAMNRASLRNEGKIHLGLIYAADPSGKTAAIQLEGALNFEPLMRSWLGNAYDSIGISTPFYYLVAKDSLLNESELTKHYSQLENLAREFYENNPYLNYMGSRDVNLFSNLSSNEIGNYFNADFLSNGFRTSEKAINTDELAKVIRKAISNDSNIRLITNAKVQAINKRGSGFFVDACIDKTSLIETFKADFLINATWEQRLKIDSMIGIKPDEGWVHRLKYRVIVKLPEEYKKHPSATMVVGRYGDVVIRPDCTAYLSWYPTGLKGWSHELAPPESWQNACKGEEDSHLIKDIGLDILKKVSEWYPAMAKASIRDIDAGAIFAFGQTDVDDKNSELHNRTRIGINQYGNFYSIDPGKLTTAPIIAFQAVSKIIGDL